MAIYMQLEGVNGSVTAAGHEKWIDCSSLQWGVGRAISSTVGSTKDREASTPSISEVTLTKMMDEASPHLFTEATIGKAKKAKIHLCKTNDKPDHYMEYELENCMISGYSVSTGGDIPSESLSLSFTKIIMKYVPHDKNGKALSPVPAGYDLEKGQKV